MYILKIVQKIVVCFSDAEFSLYFAVYIEGYNVTVYVTDLHYPTKAVSLSAPPTIPEVMYAR